jgi:hypothetical protein
MTIEEQVTKAEHLLCVLKAQQEDYQPSGKERWSEEIRAMRREAICRGRKRIVANICIQLFEAQ